jgi:nitroimidazol reductase NimA-like FMN-containing flavoprotein (pyridoxamine 5'-phosphate oxidase superfamily)
MINPLYYNEWASVNRPRAWPWTDHPPRSLRRSKRDNRRGGSAQRPRRVVLDGPPSERARVQRLPDRARYDRATLEGILDEALVCHVATVLDDQPIVIPTMFVRIGDRLYVHGSTGSRMLRALESGATACVEVTLLDGLVLARSAFHHSMNYRSVIVYGTFEPARGEEKARAMEALIERIESGRWNRIRQPSRKELAATTILSLSLTEASAKVRTGMPVEEPSDLELPVWAGVVPLAFERGVPVADLAGSAARAFSR